LLQNNVDTGGGQCPSPHTRNPARFIFGEGGTDPAYYTGRVTSLTLHSGDAVFCNMRRREGRYAGLNRPKSQST